MLIHSISTGVNGLLGCWKVLLWRISQGEGMLGLIGVDCRSSSMSASDLCDTCVVLSTVLMVLTWHSMNQLDLKKCGEEVRWFI